MERLKVYAEIASDYSTTADVVWFADEEQTTHLTTLALHELLMPMLSAGPALFVFVKKDGTLVRTVGTTNAELIPVRNRTEVLEMAKHLSNMRNVLIGTEHPEEYNVDDIVEIEQLIKGLVAVPGEEKKARKPGTNTSFYDLNKQAWSSYSEGSLVAVYKL